MKNDTVFMTVTIWFYDCNASTLSCVFNKTDYYFLLFTPADAVEIMCVFVRVESAL